MKELDKPAKKNTNHKKYFIFAIIFAILAVAFTATVKYVDVRNLEPVIQCAKTKNENAIDGCSRVETRIGLANINESVRNLFSYNEQGINPTWDKITDVAAAIIFATAAYFVILGIVQLVRRKSLKKVDCELKLLAVFYLAVVAIYVVFEKILIINHRPVLMDGILEASYPSSHALFALALAGSAILLTRNYLRPKFTTLINLAIALLALIVTFGRLLAGVHWFTDIVGSIFISAFLVSALAAAIGYAREKTLAKK